MAHRRTPGSKTAGTHQPAPAEADGDVGKLRSRIAEIRQLKADGARWNDGKKEAVERHVRSTVRDVFGPDSREFQEFEHFEINQGSWNIDWSDAQYQQQFLAGIPYSVDRLEGLIAQVKERDRHHVGKVAPSHLSSSGVSRRVFVVHGHDDSAKDATVQVLDQLGLDPVILHEQPSEGRTIIEKFEKYADVSFAVVLFTPDDLGYNKGKSPNDAQPRARQNVVFELGFFIAKLGRRGVCVLRKGKTEILSDYQGVLFVPMDDDDEWRSTLAREIKATQDVGGP